MERKTEGDRAMKDGGPAFPVGSDLGPASNICDGGYGGMTLRDYFAAKAMASIVAADIQDTQSWEMIAKDAWYAADAMLAARDFNKETER